MLLGMTDSINDLPDDIEQLKAMLLAERSEKARLASHNERLLHMLRQLRRNHFGRKSERLSEDQLNLGLEDLETAIASGEAGVEKADTTLGASRTRQRRVNRGHLPAHLPREEIVIEPQAKSCPCCGGADIVVSKYAWHLPLYRQAQMLAAEGITIDRSTLAHWVGFAAFELMPVYDRLVAHLKSSSKLFADETRCPVLDPGRGKTKTGYLWALARDDRPWGGADPPALAYTYAPGRGVEHALCNLVGFSGTLQVDGYVAYKQLADPKRNGGPLLLAHCWSHFRRLFYDIAKGGNAPIATGVLVRIAALYAIEDEIRGASPDERRAIRQARSKPLVDKLETWLKEQLARVSKGSELAKQIRYGLNHWTGLCRFLDDGRIEIDPNTVERSMRPIALSRKNALFAGSDEGAQNWAAIASLIETCKLNTVNPHAWLSDTLTKLVNRWPASRIDELMPWAYPGANVNV
jgi:transposase